MCGIAGMIGEIPSRKVLEQMQNTMRRRGPDQKGVWVKHGTALLHNRLAVIDIEGGRQPMQREHAVIVYNGELYNTAEVRTDLAKQGYVFSTHSDTEVVLTAYLAWGEACLERLNGIYAFAVWDMQKQELFFARDRIGVKPFFFTEKNGTFFQPPEGTCQRGNCPSTAETFASGMEKFRFFAKRPKFSEHDFHFCWKRKKRKTLRTKRQDFLENLCRCAKILTFNDRPKAAASGQTYDLRSGKKWIT